MQRVVALVLTMLLLLSSATPNVFASEQQRLPEMADVDILAFLDANEIVIPEGFAETDAELASLARYWIAATEANPEIRFAYNFTDLYVVSNAIKSAVNAYYGYKAPEVDLAQQTRNNPVNTYQLQYSTFYSAPSNMAQFNCYAYAIGNTSHAFDPGNFMHLALSLTELRTMYIDDLADRVVGDLKSDAFNCQCVSYSAVRPAYSELRPNQTAICARLGMGDYDIPDYHFMRLFNDNGDKWRHKNGQMAILTYNGNPMHIMPWIGEYHDGVEAHPSSINMVYDSGIRYILFSNTHDPDTSQGTRIAGDYHAGTKHYYQYATTCTECDEYCTYYVSGPCMDCGDIVVRP